MSSVFISYSRRDKDFASYIATELRQRGAKVFIDYQKLVAGENFIGRLGREVEACDYLILLLSPRSVKSKWVQSEVAWAMHRNKMIVPVLLEPASMVDFFFLIHLEQVDFTRWSAIEPVGEAIRKLALALDLPEQPIRSAAQLADEKAPVENVPHTDSEGHNLTAFSRGDVEELFFSAVETSGEDPEQATFLFRRVLEIEPDYAHGQAQRLLEREEFRLKPVRLSRMLSQAKIAKDAGEWRQAERIGRDMLTVDKDSVEAKRIINAAIRNLECEALYEQAILAAQRKRWRAAVILANKVHSRNCPDYDKLADSLSPIWIIRGELAGYIRPLSTISRHRHKDSVRCVAFSPDSTLLASGSDDASIHLWKTHGGHHSNSFRWRSPVMSVAFSPDGNLLAAAYSDKNVRLWDISTERLLTTLKGHRGKVLSVCFSSDGQLLVSASEDSTVKLWKIPDGEEFKTLEGHTGWVYSAVFSPNGKFIASSSDDRTIRLWKMPDGQHTTSLSHHQGDIFCVAFSPNGKLLASASDDQTICLWDMPKGKQRKAFQAHTDSVTSIAFSPDGELLASASDSQEIKLWTVPDGNQVATLINHESPIYGIAFSPDGKLIASASGDETVKLWGLGYRLQSYQTS